MKITSAMDSRECVVQPIAKSLNLIPPSGTPKSVDGLEDVSKVAVVASVPHSQSNRYAAEIVSVSGSATMRLGWNCTALAHRS